MKSAVIKLQRLGFSEYEAKAYTALIGDNPLTAYEISKNSGIPSSKVYEVIRKLEFRRMIQSVHGDRSKMFIPVSPDEFIYNFRSVLEENLHAVKNELKDVRTSMDTSYTWHIKDRESLVHKTRRMTETCQDTLLLQTGPSELDAILDILNSAQQRGVKIAIVHYGATNVKIGQVYRHPVDYDHENNNAERGFSVVADSKEALCGQISGDSTEAIWSMNRSFVKMAEEYVRHDIYFMKIMKRIDPLLRKKFGEGYEKLLDIYSDEET